MASVAHDLDVSDQTISSWRRQDRIERGLGYLAIWHNPKRRQSQLGWPTPTGFERDRIITVARESEHP